MIERILYLNFRIIYGYLSIPMGGSKKREIRNLRALFILFVGISFASVCL